MLLILLAIFHAYSFITKPNLTKHSLHGHNHSLSSYFDLKPDLCVKTTASHLPTPVILDLPYPIKGLHFYYPHTFDPISRKRIACAEGIWSASGLWCSTGGASVSSTLQPPPHLLVGSAYSSDDCGDGPTEVEHREGRPKVSFGADGVGCCLRARWVPITKRCARCSVNAKGQPDNVKRYLGCIGYLSTFHSDNKAKWKLEADAERSGGRGARRQGKSGSSKRARIQVNGDTLDSGDESLDSIKPNKKKKKLSSSSSSSTGTSSKNNTGGVTVDGSALTITRLQLEKALKKIVKLEKALVKTKKKSYNQTEQLKHLKVQNDKLKTTIKLKQQEIETLDDDKKKYQQENQEVLNKAEKFDNIPSFKKEKTPTQGGNSDGQWPVWIWAFLCDCLSTRISTNSLQQLLRKFQVHFLPHLDDKTFEIPSRAILDDYRFSLAPATEMLAAMKLAAAEQFHIGLDATTIDNTGTMNLWAVIQNEDGTGEHVLLAGARPQPGESSQDVVDGAIRMFESGAEKVDALRKQMNKNQAGSGRKIKIVGTGCNEQKIRSIMNDTCNGAILTQKLLAEHVERLKSETPGYDALPEHEKHVLLLRCCHHLRNLLSTESDRWSDARLKEYLKEDADELDQNARVELKFTSYLYALLKLIRRRGRDLYAKSGVSHLTPFLKDHFPNLLMGSNLGRIVGSRQDCVFESAWKTFTLRKAVAEYCATSITESGDDTGQILKTSIFVRGTSGPFMAEHWFHALTWNLVFDPLRSIMGLEGEPGEEQDFLAMAPLFDALWDLGTNLQTDPELIINALKDDNSHSLFLFPIEFKTPEVVKFLKKRGEKLANNAVTREQVDGKFIQEEIRKEILEYWENPGWEDNAKAKEYMRLCFVELGKALHISLKRSCFPVLTSQDGDYCVAKQLQNPWMKMDAALRKKHNNDAERPFAIAKALQRFFGTLRLGAIEGLVLATQNKTFVRSETVKKTAYREAGVFTGHFHKLPLDIQLAIRTVSLDQSPKVSSGPKWKQQAKDRLAAHDKKKEERIKEKRAEMHLLIQKRIQTATTSFGYERLNTKNQVEQALNKCFKMTKRTKKKPPKKKFKLGDQCEILVQQLKHRKYGCNFQYGFPVSLLSNADDYNGLADRIQQLKDLLFKIIKIERTAAGKKKYKKPQGPYTGNAYRFDVPSLGPATKMRTDIDEDIKLKADALILTEDDDELIGLEGKYLGEIFHDDTEMISWYQKRDTDGKRVPKKWGRTRAIVKILWSPTSQSFEALSELVNRDGSPLSNGSNKVEIWYLINSTLDEMIGYHADNINEDILKAQEAEKAQQEKANASKKKRKRK